MACSRNWNKAGRRSELNWDNLRLEINEESEEY